MVGQGYTAATGAATGEKASSLDFLDSLDVHATQQEDEGFDAGEAVHGASHFAGELGGAIGVGAIPIAGQAIVWTDFGAAGIKFLDRDYEAKQTDAETGEAHGSNVVSEGIDAVWGGWDTVTGAVGGVVSGVDSMREDAVRGALGGNETAAGAANTVIDVMTGRHVRDVLGSVVDGIGDGVLGMAQNISNVVGVETVGASEVDHEANEEEAEAEAAEHDDFVDDASTDASSLAAAYAAGDIGDTDIALLQEMRERGFIDDATVDTMDALVEQGEGTWLEVLGELETEYGAWDGTDETSWRLGDAVGEDGTYSFESGAQDANETLVGSMPYAQAGESNTVNGNYDMVMQLIKTIMSQTQQQSQAGLQLDAADAGIDLSDAEAGANMTADVGMDY